MKKKAIFFIGLFILVALVIFISFGISTGSVKNVENKNEIQPEEEINQNQEYDTNISLYFRDKDTKLLKCESRTVDARCLIDNPYMYIIKELIKGPKEKNLEKIMPENVAVNSASLSKGILSIDFNEKFLEAENSDCLYSVVNTMCELNEVEGVKILINGEVKEGYENVFIKK